MSARRDDPFHCALCGAALATPDSVCLQCDRQLAAVTVEPPPITPPPVNKKRRVYGRLLAIAFALSVVAIYRYIKDGIAGLQSVFSSGLFCILFYLPLTLALFGASKVEQHLKHRFPVGATYIPLTVAVVIGFSAGIYLAIQVFRLIGW
jgi:hypothetical protein